jgi:peptidyl-prolyl cis-trans isomerase SurA
MTIYRNLVLILTLVLASMNSQAALVLIDRIAVVVDQDVIMQSEIDERIRAIKAQFAAQPNTRVPPDDVLQNQVVERLIIESLQLQMADRAGIRISDAELNEALASIAAQNNMSLDQFRIALANDGMSWAAMREQVRREFAISRVQQGVMRRRIQVSEQEVKNFLASDLGESLTADQYRLGHILLELPDNPGAEDIKRVRSRAETIHQQLLDGEDFASLAIEYSSDQNALSGGDMGWRKPGQLPSIFSDLVEDMEVDDIRGPIKSGRGFHLIKLVEKRGATTEGQIAQTRVRHVLVQPNEIRSDREAEDLAKTLREEVINGREFEEVAKLYSDDPGSALSGGDLGWTRQGVFVPEFEQMMKDSDLGEISEVFKSSHGYHFLEVTGRRVEDFSERFKMGQAENYLRNQKFDEELDSWLREIRDEAFVEIKI